MGEGKELLQDTEVMVDQDETVSFRYDRVAVAMNPWQL